MDVADPHLESISGGYRYVWTVCPKPMKWGKLYISKHIDQDRPREAEAECLSEHFRERGRPVCSLSIASSSTSEPQVVDSQKPSAADEAMHRVRAEDSLSKTTSLKGRVSCLLHAWDIPRHFTNLLSRSSLAINREHGGWQRSIALHREEKKVPLNAIAELQISNLVEFSRKHGPDKLLLKEEIWGVDGSHTTIRVSDIATPAPSANGLVWFYTGFR